jgi:hypothetical protein
MICKIYIIQAGPKYVNGELNYYRRSTMSQDQDLIVSVWQLLIIGEILRTHLHFLYHVKVYNVHVLLNLIE